MGFMVPKKPTLLFILISASLLSASFAGGQRKFMVKSVVQVGAVTKESPKKFLHNEKIFVVHPRILKVNTNDYGRFDPAPALVKPPFKLIPN